MPTEENQIKGSGTPRAALKKKLDDVKHIEGTLSTIGAFQRFMILSEITNDDLFWLYLQYHEKSIGNENVKAILNEMDRRMVN